MRFCYLLGCFAGWESFCQSKTSGTLQNWRWKCHVKLIGHLGLLWKKECNISCGAYNLCVPFRIVGRLICFNNPSTLCEILEAQCPCGLLFRLKSSWARCFTLAACTNPSIIFLLTFFLDFFPSGLEIYSTTLWHLQNEVALSALAQDLVETDRTSPQVKA